jgi:hypothetical protein
MITASSILPKTPPRKSSVKPLYNGNGLFNRIRRGLSSSKAVATVSFAPKMVT